MNREILFRGKTYDGQWIFGDLMTYADTAQIWEQTENGKWNCFVDPATVGQFTGLVDRNQKRIFEGDVVEAWSQGVKAQGVVQKRIDGLWIIYPAYQKNIIWGLCPEESGETNVTVIGNIHDTKEEESE